VFRFRYNVRFEFILTRPHLRAEILEFIAQIFARVRKHLAFLFLDMVFDVFFQHFDFGRVGFVVGRNLGDICEECFDLLMFFVGFPDLVFDFL